MRFLATTVLLLAGLAVASTAMAVDLNPKAPLPEGLTYNYTLVGVLSCDNGNAFSAYYQADGERYGNSFSFGAGARLSHLEFVHFGFGFPGPYNYDIELWDAATCTPITFVNGLVAQDAADQLMVESVDLCPQEIFLSGDVLVTIDANSCADPSDCYPDLILDTQINVFCPVLVVPGGGCYDLSSDGGPFLLRVEIDNCATPSVPSTWGSVKNFYR